MPGPRPPRPDDPVRLGEYRLLGRLGEGGQGVVHLGESPAGTRVAIKVLHAHVAGDPDVRRRFLREVEAARRVPPFCTARILDVGTAGDQPYVVSEFIDGESLEQRVGSRGPLDPRDLERLAIGTATALAAIHRSGIVHRDFKPANVLLGPDGPRVVDFGIARSTDMATTSVSVMGTPPYMSPEQLSGGRLGPPSDLFSWAGTILFAGTGRTPFGRDVALAALIYRILHQECDLTGLPAGLRPVVDRCLAKMPEHRPTAEEVLLALITGDGAVRSGTAAPAGGDLLSTAMGRLGQPPPQAGPPLQAGPSPQAGLSPQGPSAPVGAPPPSAWPAFPPEAQPSPATGPPSPQEAFGQGRLGAQSPTGPSWTVQPPTGPFQKAEPFTGPSRAEPPSGGGVPTAPAEGAFPVAPPTGPSRGAEAPPGGLSRRSLLIGGGSALVTGAVTAAAILLPRYLREGAGPVTSSPGPDPRAASTPPPSPSTSAATSAASAGPTASTAAATPSPSRLITSGPGEPLVLRNGNLVQGLAISADGRTVAAGCWDGKVRLWKVPAGEVTAELDDREFYVQGVALSPDGRRLVSVGGVRDTEAHVWDVASGRRVGKPVVGAFFAEFSPDGERFVTGSGFEWVRLWRTSDRRQEGASMRHGQLVAGAAFSPDGRLLATAGWDRAVRLWRTSGKAAGVLNGHKDQVNAVVFLDGTTLASAGYDKVVRVWDVASRKPEGPVFKGSGSTVNGLACSPDGAVLVAGTDEDGVWLWDVATRRSLRPPLPLGQVHAVAFSGDGLVLAVAAGNDVLLYDVGGLRAA
ncbi:serine/threonine protein kinase [Planomonospora sphaerica]|uniref:Serine/threonine protein kinase n=1 Tax=Planomonospora sphaerica TaxID=161355 RepID=A0A171BUT9_9ACTN|nr:serine/threonine-protein kinase [Planomonospora sphaerica]GAT65609.1 serine/threonine protein kinase [Planomonospora sphaerica]